MKKWSAGFSCLVFLGMGAFAAQARAQELPPKSYMNKDVFYLPVKIEDRVRANLREVQLYSKDNPNKHWVLQERATPNQTYFTFRAPHEGEYWFTVVTVDKSGRLTPNDLRKEGPGLIVVRDTQMPQVDVQPLPNSPGEGACFRCTVKDANPDLTKTRFFYQTGDKSWRPVNPMPNQMDQFCIPPQAVFTGMVKVEACDLAGNTVKQEFNMGTTQVAEATQEKTQEPASPLKTTGFAPNAEKTPGVKTLPMTVESISTSKAPAPFPIEQVTGPDIEPPMAKPSNNASGLIPAEVKMPGMESERLHLQPGPICNGQKSCSMAKHMVNKTHVFLQYQIEDAGPSGVGKVEFWMTRDKGMTWQKLCEDQKHQSPVEVDLPGEGLYGISMVVSNGRGFGAVQPAAGNAPDWWIEVDTTKPIAEIKGIRNGTGSDSGCVFVTWSACDKNLAGEPIDLYYALSLNGPWQPIAQNLKNDGQYCWHTPNNITGDAFVRLVAHDAAGNSTVADCMQPVSFDDLSRPRGRLTGVSTAMPGPETMDTQQTVDYRK
jgi:hypothetical protein